MISLANKYRPKTFDDVVGQNVCVTILSNQIKNNTFSHSILLAGNAGCGKTTCARIMANMINGEIIELDCASHNGVADIKEIIEGARSKPLIHEYKVYILDECHTLTPQAWASLLITLEENIQHTIFIFCTTDTQKIPQTIISRVQRINLVPIADSVIQSRLEDICKQEGITDVDEWSIAYIVKSANGSLRQALTNLDMCLTYGSLHPDAVCKVLNIISVNVMDELYNMFEKKHTTDIIRIIESAYENGYELHQFMRQFLDYAITKSNMDLVERLLTILQDIRYDESPKNIIIARLII